MQRLPSTHVGCMLAALFLVINLVVPQQAPQQFTINNPCSEKDTCSKCIQTPSCAWCYDPNFSTLNSKSRCFVPSFVDKNYCSEEYIHNPDNVMGILSNIQLSRSRMRGESGGAFESGYKANFSSSGQYEESFGKKTTSGSSFEGSAGITQLSPQRISLKLRAKQAYGFKMYYTQAEDYPVDLYYLMDLSKSMEDDKEKLSKLGDRLAYTMQNITTNFTLGFGSFVDKVVMPYVSTLPEKLLQPCTGCVAPYGFRNHMILSTNTTMFSHMVREASVSGNLDAPEGGFDAIMQAVVCRHEIGWREKARRLLVFSTDAGFHYAGDGKLGGIVQPNDGRCHLDHRGYYTMSSKLDYPSVSQINNYVKKNAINVIFAVTADKLSIYKQLQSHIEGASCAKLSNDSSNIVELIKNQYEAISSTVEMKHNASSAVNIKFSSRCLSSDGQMVDTNKCGEIKLGDLVEFKIELEVIECPRNPKDWLQTIQIYPVGINESLIIDLEMLCDCPCERPGDLHYIENARECHGHGTYKCGVCECFPGAYGLMCDCLTNQTSTKNTSRQCKLSPNDRECSGRGNCICGTCECEIRTNENERIYGKYCECDNFSCERHNGELCSGPSHGTCNCGKCDCTKEWEGRDCGCIKSTATCIAPGAVDGEICSGNGVCECGECKCKNSTEGRYFGRFCEQCPKCTDQCEQYKNCTMCQQYHTGPLTDKECKECPFVPTAVDVVEVNEENNEKLCTYYDKDDCRFTFVYYYNEDKKIAVRVQKEKECPPKVFLLGIVLGVIAAVVLMGLAILLLWKLLTTIHDRREFAKFEKERMMAKWDTGENPIYKQATSTFKNPTYAGKS